MQMQQPMQKNMPPVPPSDSALSWQQGGQQPGQALSVVTTVWNVTQTTQTGPYNQPPTGPGFTNTTMSTTPYTQQPQGFPGNQIQKPYNPQSMNFARQNSAPYNRNGYPPTPTTPTDPPNGGPPPEAALSAAALVAAAATATATATATAVMGMQEQQQRPQMNMNMNVNMSSMNNQYPQMPPQQYNNQYPPQQRPPGPMGMGMNMGQPGMGQPGMGHPGMGQPRGPGGAGMPVTGPMKQMNSMSSMYRRPTPYPNPQYMQNKNFPNAQPVGDIRPPYHGPQQYPQGVASPQYPGKPGYPPTQQPLPSPTYAQHPQQHPHPQHPQHPQQMQQRPQGPPGPNGYGPNPYMTPAYNRQPPPGPGYNPSFQQQPPQQFPNQMYSHSPIGNPTPPMTPGPSVPPYMSPDIKPNMADLKPQMVMKRENDELRLTFPVRDGVVLPPFRLEHNLAVSNHVFHLRESVYQTLMWRSDLELQLKCFHHEDRQMNTNWPASVTVSVNATPLNIERGENKTSHKPLYLKEVCQPGRNTIQITVTACCCSHLFVLQLVHRPSVRSVLQGLLRKRLLPAEHCITKKKKVPTATLR